MGQFSLLANWLKDSKCRLALLLAFAETENANHAGQGEGAGAATDAHDVDRDGRVATLGLVIVKTVEDQTIHAGADLALGGLDQAELQRLRQVLETVEVTSDF